jgi:hypothetical protein
MVVSVVLRLLVTNGLEQASWLGKSHQQAEHYVATVRGGRSEKSNKRKICHCPYDGKDQRDKTTVD